MWQFIHVLFEDEFFDSTSYYIMHAAFHTAHVLSEDGFCDNTLVEQFERSTEFRLVNVPCKSGRPQSNLVVSEAMILR